MSFLIDTDTCSAHLKQRGNVTNRFLQFMGGHYVSTITLGELSAWVFRAQAPPGRLQAMREMISDMTVLDVTVSVAEKYGELQAGLLDIGRPAPGMDLLIAATALVHDLTLVTHNTRDFVGVPGVTTHGLAGHHNLRRSARVTRSPKNPPAFQASTPPYIALAFSRTSSKSPT